MLMLISRGVLHIKANWKSEAANVFIFIYAFRFSLRKTFGLSISGIALEGWASGKRSSVNCVEFFVLRLVRWVSRISHSLTDLAFYAMCSRSIKKILKQVDFYQSVSNRTRVRDWNRRESVMRNLNHIDVDDVQSLRSDLNRFCERKALSSSNLVEGNPLRDKGRPIRAEGRNKLLWNLIWMR